MNERATGTETNNSPMLKAVVGLGVLAVVVSVAVGLHLRGEAAQLRVQLDAEHANATRLATEAAELRDRLSALSRKLAQLESQSAAALTVGGTDETQVLRKKLAALEAELAKLRTEEQKPDVKVAARPQPERPTGGMQGFMDRLKESDPERYAAMVKRMQEANQRVDDQFGRQAQFLSGLDTKNMTEEQRENHEQLLEMIEATRALTEAIEEEPDAEDVPEMRREVFQNLRAMREPMDVERQAALGDLGRNMGYDEPGTVGFVDYVNHVYEMTSTRSLWGRGGRGGGGMFGGRSTGGGGRGGR